MEHIGRYMRARKTASAKNRATERGELLRLFSRRLNVSRARDGFGQITMARMGKILQGIPTKDLYYLKSVCERANDFSKRFWWEIDPKKHLEQGRGKKNPKFKKRDIANDS